MAQFRARWTLVLALLAVSAARLDGQSVLRQGVEFQVNSYITNDQDEAAVDLAADGDFVVTWTSFGQDGDSLGIFGRRFNANGVSQALDFRVNSYTVGSQQRSSVGLDTGGAFVVAWDSYDQDDGVHSGVFARRFDAAGIAQAVEFQVNTYTPNYQARPVVAVSGGGDFVVAWQSYLQDGSSNGTFVRRFNAAGVAQAVELQVNTYTSGSQGDPAIAIDGDGDFVVVWSSDGQDGSGLGVFAHRFNSAGAPQAVELQVNAYTTSAQGSPTVAAQGNGAFVVAWNDSTRDGSSGVFARVFNAAGVAQATELQVNTYTIGAQIFPTAGVDANGSVTALTDGLLIVRFLFGFTGTTLTNGVTGAGCMRCDSAAIVPYLEGLV